jgi:hypothetical protein
MLRTTIGFIWRQAMAIGCGVLAWIALGCGGSGDSESPTVRIEHHGGVSATVPADWKPVRLHSAPGADVPLQVASFDPYGAEVNDICNPGSRILRQITAGDALIQLLEDHPSNARIRREFPPLTRPFHLGRPEGHECGEAYNVFFHTEGRFFQLRIWTAENQDPQAHSPSPPSRAVRTQIEVLMDSLRV